MKNDGLASKKLESLQAIRALAFLGICSGHCALTRLGAWGVAVFLNLSGFLLVYRHYSDEKIQGNISEGIKYGLKKILALYPLHILMMIAALVLHFKLGGKFSLLNLISNILLFQSWIPSMNVYFSLNGVAWYLSTILFLYIVFPVILLKIRKLNSIRSAIITAGFIYTLQIVCGYWAQVFINNTNIDIPDFVNWFTYICPLFRMGDFLIGCLFGYIFIKTEHSNNQVQGTLLELFPFLILIVVQLLNANNILFFNMDFFQNTIMYIPIASCFVFNFARNEGMVSKLLVCKPIMYIGDFSNYNFLIHGIIIAYVTTFSLWLGRPLSPLYKFLIALPISLLCSYIYIRIEQFITVKLKQKMKR